MRWTPLLLLVALVGGCPIHQADVETTVAADGWVARRMVFRETKNNDVWGFFAPPEAPFQLSGSPEEGMVATATWPAGPHQGGLRFWVEPKDAGESRKATPPSDVRVTVQDLIVGKLYLYRERFDLGLDPALVRDRLARWLDLGAEMMHEALSIRFQGTDFGPLKKRFDEQLKPRLLATALRLQLVPAALMRDWQNTRVSAEEPGWLRNPFLKVVLDELALWGVLDRREANLPWLERQAAAAQREGQKFTEELQARLRKWARSQLEPGLAHLGQAKRDEVFAVLFENDEAFSKAMKEVTERRFPEGADQKEAQREVLALATAFFGAGVHAMFQDVALEFTLRLPGRVIHTNGDLAWGRVRWHLNETELSFIGPLLHATSVDLLPWAQRMAERNRAAPRRHASDLLEFIAGKEMKLDAVRAVAAIDDHAKRAEAAKGLHGNDQELWDRLLRLLGDRGQ